MENDFTSYLQENTQVEPVQSPTPVQPQPTQSPVVSNDGDFTSYIQKDPEFKRTTDTPSYNKPVTQTSGYEAVEKMFSKIAAEDPIQPGPGTSTADEIRDLDQTYVAPNLQQEVPGAAVAPPGENISFGVRADVGASSTLSAQAKKLKEYYPFGDVRLVTYPNNEQALLIQTAPNGPYARVSPTFTEKWDNFVQLFGALARQNADNPLGVPGGYDARSEVNTRAYELLKDIFADNSVDVGIGLLSALATGGTSGFVGTTFRAGAAGLLGKVAAETVDVLRTYSNKSPTEIGAEGVGTGILEGIFAGAFKAISLGWGLAKGQAAGEIPEVIRKIRQAATEMGLPDFMPQQASPSEIIRRLTARSEALTTRIKNYREKQEAAAEEKFRGLANGSYRDTFKLNIEHELEQWKNGVLSAMRDPKVTFHQAGNTIDNGIDLAIKRQRPNVQALYQAAKDAGSPEYDITPVQNLAKEILTGVTQMGKEGTKPSSLVDEFGKPLGSIKTPAEPVRVSDTTDLVDIIDRINRLDPNVINREGVSTPMEALQKLRSELWDYTMPDPTTGLRRLDARDAIRLRDAIDEVLENPVSGDPNVVTLWRQASKAQRELYEVTEVARIHQFMKAGDSKLVTTPESMARTLLSSTGRNTDNIYSILKVLTPEERETVRGAVVSDLLRDPYNLTKRINDYTTKSPETAGLLHLIDPSIEKPLIAIGKKFDQLKTSGLEKIIEEQNGKAFQTISALATNDKTVIGDLLVEMAKKPDMPLWKDLRAGIIDYIFENSKQLTDEGIKFHKLSAEGLIKNMEKLGANGKDLLRFLTPDDLKMMDTVSHYLNIIQNRGKGEVAAALSAGHAITALTYMGADALHALSTAHLIGRVVTNGRMQKFLMGSPVSEAAEPSAALVRFGALLGAVVNDISSDAADSRFHRVPTTKPVQKMADGGFISRGKR